MSSVEPKLLYGSGKNFGGNEADRARWGCGGKLFTGPFCGKIQQGSPSRKKAEKKASPSRGWGEGKDGGAVFGPTSKDFRGNSAVDRRKGRREWQRLKVRVRGVQTGY